MSLVPHMPMSAIAALFRESDTTFWRIFKHYVNGWIKEELDLNNVSKICVDETAIKIGHNCMTIFTDYDTGSVIYVTEEREKEVFEQFYGWLFDKGGHPGIVKLMSIDMSKSYKAGCHDYFAHSEVVFDRFHIKKAINDALNKVRIKENADNIALKNTKYLWLKNDVNLTDSEKEKLAIILADTSLKTGLAYKLKLEFEEVWRFQHRAIEPALKAWCQRVKDSKIRPLISFVRTLVNHWKGVINALKMLINNGVSEGINSKIQAAKSKARGYPNSENFKAMIYYIGNDMNLSFH